MGKIILFLVPVLFFPSFGTCDEITKDLPAGGTYVFQTKWDKITVNCTAKPLVPSVLSKTCTCTRYYAIEHGQQVFYFALGMKALLSDGTATEVQLASGLDSREQCYKELHDQFSDVCKSL